MSTFTPRDLVSFATERGNFKPSRADQFDAWMAAVDKAVQAKVGLSVHDLPDYCFRDAFDDGRTPRAVAAEAIRNARD